MGYKKIIYNKETSKRRWDLFCQILNFSDGGGSLDKVLSIEFGAESHEEALDKTIQVLRKEAKRDFLRFFRPKSYIVTLHPLKPLQGDMYVSSDELFRLKLRYSDSNSILKIQRPSQYFVKGYGSEAERELMNL